VSRPARKRRGFSKEEWISKKVDGCGTTAVQVKGVEDHLGILVGRSSLAPFVNRTVLNAGTIEALEQWLILH
jgi:hypothetical protein